MAEMFENGHLENTAPSFDDKRHPLKSDTDRILIDLFVSDHHESWSSVYK